MPPGLFLESLARHLGGTRILALPLLRILAVLAGVAWALAAPLGPERGAVDLTIGAFCLYSAVIIAALYLRPRRVLRQNLVVLVVLLVDVAFALVLVHLTGGAGSTLFLALLLIAGLQSYYYGMARGIAVAVGSGAAYLAVVWPTIVETESANVIIRLVTLLGTAIAVGVLGDIEEHERLQVSTLTSAAQAHERFVQGVVESIRDGVVALDANGRVVTWNSVMEARYGRSAAEAIGMPLGECIPDGASAPWRAPLARLLGGELEEFTVRAVEGRSATGGRLVQDVKAGLLKQPGGRAGAVLVLEDVTARLALERSARQAEKLAALGTLAAGLAHELNNPIGIISSRVELMLLDAESRPLPPDLREDLEVLHRHSNRIARITQGLLSFARHSPGKPARVDLNRIVDDALLLAEKQMVKDGIAVKRSLAPDLPFVWGDANALEQVIVNLIGNARDALAAGGEVAIETTAVAQGSGVRLTVRDNGPGIPPEIVARLFEPFFTTKPHGTGLGLSISYGIVREHGGTVDVESAPEKGTSFTLTFPAEEKA